MRVDAYLPGDAGLPEAGRLASRAQLLGYDGVMVAEMRHDPFLVAASVASSAPGVTVGTAVAIAFARSPMTVAYTAWDLAALTGGRFVLGLGTQVRAHVVHRFSMPWSAPVARLREYVDALRTIWGAWQDGQPLRFRGEHYRFSLMTPFFDPGPQPGVRVPIAIAGVGPGLSRLAGEAADGFHVHPFHTVGYLKDVVVPAIADGAAAAGRSVGDIERFCSVFVATGRTEDDVVRARDALRTQIAFYASTPSYRPVLEHGGWDVGEQLTALSKRGAWAEMSGLVTDEMVDAMAVVAPVDELGDRLRDRYDGVLDRIGIYPGEPLGLTDDEESSLVASIRG